MKNIRVYFAFLLLLSICNGSEIVINEIMYHALNSDLEWIELYNSSSQSINLANWYILDDNDSHTKCYLNGVLNPGEYLVVARIVSQFKTAYPNVTNVYSKGFGEGSDAWSLGNGGDVVRLFDASGNLHDIVAYDDENGWPTGADGKGPSLELMNPNYDNSKPFSWKSSLVSGGTPGKINSVFTYDAPPICRNGKRLIDLPTNSELVPISVYAYDIEGLSSVELMVNIGTGYFAIPMHDDGLNGDAIAGDTIYTALIPTQPSGTLVKYYCIAQDLIGQTNTWPNNAPIEYRAYTVDYKPPALLITEVLPSNSNINTDEYGQYDDWIEIYNKDTKPVNLKDKFISHSLTKSIAFKLPEVILNPGDYLLIWADNTPSQGSLHADFNLSAEGDEVALWESIDYGNVLIHGWVFGKVKKNISIGYPNLQSNAPEYLKTPTPKKDNSSSPLFSPICINEFQCKGTAGSVDDWVEIYNRGNQTVDLSGYFLSDNLKNLTKWSFPKGTILKPGEFIVVDENTLGFGFSSSGEEVIVITAPDTSTVLDFFDYGPQLIGYSQGRYPDGASFWCYFSTPTKGSSNKIVSELEHGNLSLAADFKSLQNYPNPFNPATEIVFTIPKFSRIRLAIYDILGREITVLADDFFNSGKCSIIWQPQDLPSGIYLCMLKTPEGILWRKMAYIK